MKENTGFDQALQDYCAAPAPNPAFAARLERQLTARAAHLREETERRRMGKERLLSVRQAVGAATALLLLFVLLGWSIQEFALDRDLPASTAYIGERSAEEGALTQDVEQESGTAQHTPIPSSILQWGSEDPSKLSPELAHRLELVHQNQVLPVLIWMESEAAASALADHFAKTGFRGQVLIGPEEAWPRLAINLPARDIPNLTRLPSVLRLDYILGLTGENPFSLPELPRQMGKTWLETDPVQCQGNAWEQDALPGCDLGCQLQRYFSGHGVEILALRTVSLDQKFGRSVALCEACDCPAGYTLYVQVADEDVEKMLALGFRFVIESCAAVNPSNWPYGCGGQ